MLLLADEPFMGLSPRSAQTLVKLLSELHREGATLVTAASNWREIENPPTVDRVVISGGKLRSEGPEEGRAS
jgi:ABC-type multidrug transport system ATPase subunit